MEGDPLPTTRHPPPPPAPSFLLCASPPSSWRSITSSTTAASIMARGSSKTVVKRTRDEALEHIKLALRTKSCLFTKQEVSFIRTSCQILGVDSHAAMRAIQEEVESNRMKQPRKVMEYLQSRLKELAERVEKHKRPTPNPAGCTRAGNPIRWWPRCAAWET